MTEKLRVLFIVNWQTTLAGIIAGTFSLLEVNGGAFDASLDTWIKASAIAILGIYSKSVIPNK
jgi:hypothetical protein